MHLSRRISKTATIIILREHSNKNHPKEVISSLYIKEMLTLHEIKKKNLREILKNTSMLKFSR